MAGLSDLRDKVALVTGASSGIGEGLARELARRGARVALAARRVERLQTTAKALQDAGHQASAHSCDVRDPASIADACDQIESRWGRIDLLVNNAGYGRHIMFVDHDPADIQEMMLTNYMGMVHTIKRVLPGMREQGSGWILNVGSFAGKIGQADEVAYSASKFAVTGLSQGLAQELEPDGVHVLCVHPTLVETEMFTPEVRARLPKSSAGSFISVDKFASLTLDALARGRTEAVIPTRMRGPILLHDMFPNRIGKLIGRVKMDAVRESTG